MAAKGPGPQAARNREDCRTRTRLLPVIICSQPDLGWSAGRSGAGCRSGKLPPRACPIRAGRTLPRRTALASALLSGYSANIATLSVPIGYEALERRDGRVSGNWMPAQQSSATIWTPRARRRNWSRTRPAPSSRWRSPTRARRLASRTSPDAQKDAFGGKIGGIEPAPPNQSIAAIIAADKFGRATGELVESGNRPCWRR